MDPCANWRLFEENQVAYLFGQFDRSSRHAVPAVVDVVSFLLKAFGYRLRVPWLGYRAVTHLGHLVRPNWKVLEFGSGMSSLFFARACSNLVSVESDQSWHDRMQEMFSEEGMNNIDYRLCDPDSYNSHPDLPINHFDLIVIDGMARDVSAQVAIQLVRPGGYIFYDNSDVPWEEYRKARNLLTAAAESNGVTIFNDFTPFQIQVNESMLVKISKRQH